jgi:hypothetical protein
VALFQSGMVWEKAAIAAGAKAVSPVSGGIVSASGGMSPVSGGVVSASGGMSPVSGGVVSASGGMSPVSGDVVSASGGMSPVSGGIASASGDMSPTVVSAGTDSATDACHPHTGAADWPTLVADRVHEARLADRLHGPILRAVAGIEKGAARLPLTPASAKALR